MQSVVCMKHRRKTLRCRELAYIERSMEEHQRDRNSSFISIKLHKKGTTGGTGALG